VQTCANQHCYISCHIIKWQWLNELSNMNWHNLLWQAICFNQSLHLKTYKRHFANNLLRLIKLIKLGTMHVYTGERILIFNFRHIYNTLCLLDLYSACWPIINPKFPFCYMYVSGGNLFSDYATNTFYFGNNTKVYQLRILNCKRFLSLNWNNKQRTCFIVHIYILAMYIKKQCFSKICVYIE